MKKLKGMAMLVVSLSLALAALGSNAASAVAAPIWSIESKAPDRAAPGSVFSYRVTIRNIGDDDTDSTGSVDIELPDGITALSVHGTISNEKFTPPLTWNCGDPSGMTSVHCAYEPPTPLPVGAGEMAVENLMLEVELDPEASGIHTAKFEVSGGGASSAASSFESVKASATPDFGISRWDGHIPPDEDGALQAGAHPKDIVTDFDLNTFEGKGGDEFDTYGLLPEADLRHLTADLPPGFVGAPTATPTCDLDDLAPTDYIPLPDELEGSGFVPACPVASIVGTIAVRVAEGDAGTVGLRAIKDGVYIAPIFNMRPPKGEPPRFGFNIVGLPQQLSASARTDGDLGIQVKSIGTSQGLTVLGSTVTFWGVPGDPSHDFQRCQIYAVLGGLDHCPGAVGDPVQGPNSVAGGLGMPFLTLPTSCSSEGEGLRFDVFMESWPKPSVPSTAASASFLTTKDPPADNTPIGTSGCDRVPFQPEIEVQPTTDEAETPSGLEVALTVPPDGLENPTGISQSHLKDAVVSLPEGMTVNPSQANGLAVCGPSQIGLTSGDGRPIRFNAARPNCPDASQLGEVRIDTPLLEEPLNGAVFLAQQSDPTVPGSENPFNSDLALYIVAEGSGQLVKLAGEVTPNPNTGQVVTRFLNNPQVPFSRFALKFKGGQRAPLSMPPTCGTFTTKAVLSPWARPDDPVTVSDTFNITKGPNGGPCPSGGVPPFKPGFTAGTLNNNAGSYSPFVMRLTRADGEQDMTKFSSILPPGVVGKLAGVSKCSDAALAAAPQRTGRQEISSPSCPASSQIGRVEAGAGVGSLQVYVGGKIYLAGPYNGAPLSVAVITPAVAGPFDVGNVVVREALDLNPKTAEVSVDGEKSDPIPHILKGIPLRLRDLRVFVDRDNFILNPTSCDESATRATLFGSFLDVLSPADDVPVSLEDRFQAANCANLGLKPKLDLKLTGGTKRGGHPGLKATYVPRPGDANVSGLVVRLPRSAFLDQAHIRTICTRVQFAADNCPPAAQYGYIRAFTPLLDEPLQGPIWLRSSNNKLPDLVFDLQGIVDVEVATRIDSVRGGIRASVESAPDAPLSKVVVTMQGGKKGLIVNSTNLCKGTNRGEASFTGHNGKTYEARPVVKPVGCGGKRKGGRR